MNNEMANRIFAKFDLLEYVWRQRADEIAERFGDHRATVFTHCEVLRMCAKEIVETLKEVRSDELSSQSEALGKVGRQ